MKIAVIGAGVSGVTFAINRKKKHPEDEVVIFEHLDKALKKILSTGNGRCNIGNKLDISGLQESPLVKDILVKYDFDVQKDFLNSINIKNKLINELEYPITESAVTVRNLFLTSLEKNQVKLILNSRVLDYQLEKDGIQIITNDGEYLFDKLVIATGGKSSPKLGSDGSFLDILLRHNYQIKEFQPGLCPIYTKEKTKVLDGPRVKAIVKLLRNKKPIFEEYGEVLFKEHGLSGIVIFNASRLIAQDINKDYKISIDLLPETSREELRFFLKDHTVEELLNSYLHPNIVKYIQYLKVKNAELVDTLKSLTFSFDKLYGFDNSQVSVGGIPFESVDEKLGSKTEKGLHFLGELLDYSAPCGGYNLMWAIGSALYLSDIL